MKKRILSVIALLVVLAIMLTFSARLLNRKTSYNKYRIFYEKSQDFDVLFFGASVVHYAVYPMQLWHDYGITSYNMGNDSERLHMTYYDLLNSLDYANPKLVVVDLSAMGWAGNDRDNTLKDHFFTDALPFSRNKLQEINDIFPGEQAEYLFPFTLYHSRWNELTSEDFHFNTRDVRYGATLEPGIEKTTPPTKDLYEESRVTDVFLEYDNVKNMIDLCNSRNIPIIFTYLPNGHRGGDQKCREQCAKLMESFDVDYYDLLNVDFVDWNRDLVDGAHLNYFGAIKLTDFYGQMLSTRYNLPDHREDKAIAPSWNSDYDEYLVIVNELITNHQEEYEAAK